ncbi:MAG: DUF2088 domain-containing protein [Anaerolineaceae bacterium]|nr:DUF2088 domain-containing protein [Anaerolineaceae bacterium]
MIETREYLPQLCAVRRRLPSGEEVNIRAQIRHEWERLNLAEQVKGKSIALGFGSRGVARIDEIAREMVAMVKASGGDPFIVPAMGSHGGATPAGQIEVLSGLGITEESAGCPIRATMETVILGHTGRGQPVHFDRFAAEADGYMICNRIKIHTDFHGPHESGLIKMLGIGMAKEIGAASLHDHGVVGLRDYMPENARLVLQNTHFMAGFGVVEDGYHRPVHLEAFTKSNVEIGEKRLLDLARSLMPRLPVDDIDVLIIDFMGKDISGAGMDTNVIGRWRIPGEPEPETPRIKAIVILDLTEASHGNAIGTGLADFTTRRLLDKIDFPVTTKNAFTSGFLMRGNLPMVFATDAEAIDAALTSVFRANPQAHGGARVMRIRSTLDLEQIWVSATLLDEVTASDGFIDAGELQPLQFENGVLI